MSDNGAGYRSTIHAFACRALGIRHLRTRPYRPQTNGKAERFIRTLIAGWAYGAIYGSSHERTRALDGWLWTYNHRRPHGSLSHKPPVQTASNELNNLARGLQLEFGTPPGTTKELHVSTDSPTPSPIVLIHGLWLTPLSWEDWVQRFEGKGHRVLAPAWPRLESRSRSFAGIPLLRAARDQGITDHYDGIIRGLDEPPIIIGHSFGGLITSCSWTAASAPRPWRSDRPS